MLNFGMKFVTYRCQFFTGCKELLSVINSQTECECFAKCEFGAKQSISPRQNYFEIASSIQIGPIAVSWHRRVEQTVSFKTLYLLAAEP